MSHCFTNMTQKNNKQANRGRLSSSSKYQIRKDPDLIFFYMTGRTFRIRPILITSSEKTAQKLGTETSESMELRQLFFPPRHYRGHGGRQIFNRIKMPTLTISSKWSDLSPCEFTLFPWLERDHECKCFADINELICNFVAALNDVKVFKRCYQEWNKRLGSVLVHKKYTKEI